MALQKYGIASTPPPDVDRRRVKQTSVRLASGAFVMMLPSGSARSGQREDEQAHRATPERKIFELGRGATRRLVSGPGESARSRVDARRGSSVGDNSAGRLVTRRVTAGCFCDQPHAVRAHARRQLGWWTSKRRLRDCRVGTPEFRVLGRLRRRGDELSFDAPAKSALLGLAARRFSGRLRPVFAAADKPQRARRGFAVTTQLIKRSESASQ